MSSREQIFARLKKAVGQLPEPAAYPDYEPQDFVAKAKAGTGDVVEAFRKNFAAVHGKVVVSIEELKDLLESEKVACVCCDPDLRERLVPLGIALETSFDRGNPDHCQAGVSWAAGAIAESGTLVLKDGTTPDRMIALAPWVHVAVLKRSEIVRTLPEAVAALGTDPNAIFVTGPSKTADIEGILIEGVHGPGVQVAWIVD